MSTKPAGSDVADVAGADGAGPASPERLPSTASRYLLLATAALIVLLLDQLTKAWAVNTLDDRTIDLVGSLRLRLIYNTGAAFSMGASLGPWIGMLAVAVVIVLVVLGGRMPSVHSAAVLGMILGGALGNLGDRAFRRSDGLLDGAVVDFIDLQWWPVFNVADMAIVIGGLLLALLASTHDFAEDP